jgi:hypothetical protein
MTLVMFGIAVGIVALLQYRAKLSERIEQVAAPALLVGTEAEAEANTLTSQPDTVRISVVA